jgi:hypothetical protein
MHSEWLAAYELDPSTYRSASRATLPISERLAVVLDDGHALDKARAPAQRAIGTCRDFALMLCSFLRTLGTPARVRCGFASYFVGGWEDHWICEYWDSNDENWHLADAQLDEVIRTACKVSFNPLDLPPGVFLTAGEAWLRCRSDRDNPGRFGNGGTNGPWFMMVDVVRDWSAVNDRVTSAWDRWREASPEQRVVPADELPRVDDLAHNPEQAISDRMPPWLARAAEAA